MTGAVGGARHGLLGIILGGAGGVVCGSISFVAVLSPLALMSLEPRGLRAKFENLVAGLGLFVLIPIAPVGAGFATWSIVHLIG